MESDDFDMDGPLDAEDRALLDRLAEVLAPEAVEPPLDRVTQLRASVTATRRATAGPRRSISRWTVAAVAAVALLGGLAVGLAVRSGQGSATDQLEFEETLRDPQGDATGTVTGVKTGIGRVVHIRTDELPILPIGEYYEVWFVGPGDGPTTPNRISAGTFHPDADGLTDVTLAAAVDPALYPVLAITAEPGDGDPSPGPVEVLRTTITLE